MPSLFKRLRDLYANRNTYADAFQKDLESLVQSADSIEKMESMKATAGWKLLEQRIRQELANTIATLVKDDKKIQTLLAVLQAVETKSAASTLEETIRSILPEA